MRFMNIFEKRDYIHNHLSQADEALIDELFERFHLIFEKEAVLKAKITTRAKTSEANIRSGKLFSRDDAEKRPIHVKK